LSEEFTVLREMFDAAVAAAQPQRVVADNLPEPPVGRTVVIGAGKASAAMAQGFEQHWKGDPAALSGLVVTRYDYAVPCQRIEIVEAAHPVPDAAGERAAARILDLVSGLTADDLVVCLISGGASALLSLPADGLTLADKQEVNRQLLGSGANIGEMNCVRKHLSAIKGGRLAAACAPAQLVSLLISDVPDDDPAVIGSGPTVADPTSFADALAIVDKYGISEPAAALDHLRAAASETPKPGDASLQRLQEVALVHAGIVKQVCRHRQPLASPCVLLSGGETTVTLKGTGRGGRNAEFSLALALSLKGMSGVYALAADTDGIDGSEDNAGALLGPETLARAEQMGVEAAAALENNDGYGFFARLDDLLMTGPTMTNVNDFRAILIAGN